MMAPSSPVRPNPIQPAPKSLLQRYGLVAALGAALLVVGGVIFANGWHRQLKIENVVALRDTFQSFLTSNKTLSLLVYVLAYAVAVSLSLPGALVLTLSGGLMFGWLVGGLAAVVGATIGACVIYFVARTALGDTMARKAGPMVQKLSAGFKENALSYLLFLRLVPAFPFFLVNLVPGLIGVPFRTYLIGTFFGIIPATLAFASVGAGFDSVLADAKVQHAACVAQKGADACVFAIKASNLLTGEIKIAFVLLGLMALIPIVYKKWSGKHVNAR
ncbi:MAG: TVP38/TMEM64 family protein [Hyphomicrobiaceae bacterium]|nr:TVP38/TMEM64 family protein [Hyphomicrobiaceae bacterium]